MNIRAVDTARSRIVLFGTPSYVDSGLLDVPVVANNVRDLAAVLTDPDLGGFDPAHCVTVPGGATAAEIGEPLMQAAAEAEDLLLFYYSGHGMPWRDGEWYLCLANTRTDRLPFTALQFEAVRDAFLGSRAKNRVIILDSCYSGRAIGGNLGDSGVLHQLEVNGAYMLTSASANREALYLPGEPHTAFTERLLHLLRTGLPEAGPWLSMSNIYLTLIRQLRAESLPEPQCLGRGTAELLGLTRNPAYSPISAEAAVVQEAVARRAVTLPESPPAGSSADRLRQRAEVVLFTAELDARTLPEESRKALALADIAQAQARLDPDRAERTVRGITSASQRAHALAGIAQALAATDPDRAGKIAQGITDASAKAQAFTDIARIQASADPERADALWDEAEAAAQAILPPPQKAHALAGIALALASADPDRAEGIAQRITQKYQKAYALAGIAQAVALTDPDWAEDITQGIADANQKALALAGIAQTLAPAAPERADRLWGEAEATARAITHGQQKAQTLAKIVLTLAATDPGRAGRIAQGITDASAQAQALAGIALVLAPSDPDWAEDIARGIPHGHQKALALARVARALAPEDSERAIRLAAEAEGIAQSIANELSRVQALAGIAHALADTSPDRAEDIARSIPSQSAKTMEPWKAQALAAIARVWLGAV